MNKISYNQFIEIIGKYRIFDRLTLKALYEEFGEEVINKYFDEYYQSLNEEEASSFMEKYSVYFEKLFSGNLEKDYSSYDSVSTIGLMIASSLKYPIMTADMEKEQGYILEEAEKKLVIAKNINEDFILYPDLKLEKIFLSVKTKEHLELISKIKKLPYLLCDELVLKNDIEKIKKFLKVSSNSILTLDELKKEFPELCFDNITPVEDLKEQLELLEKYIIAKFNFYNRNLRLVLSITKRGSTELSFEDKIQEGCLGLIKAINNYKVSSGYRFSTYATNWIKQSAIRAVSNDGYLIRIPVHFRERIKKYRDFVNKYMVEHGGEPSLQVCAEELNLTEEQIVKVQMIFHDNIVSLDTPLASMEDGSDFIHFIEDETVNIEDDYFTNELIDFVNAEIDAIPSVRDRKILRDRWGLNEEKMIYTLEEIGKHFSITRERVRQVEKREKRKIHCKLKKAGYVR